ncbi:MAG: glycosyltransferase family 4 protein [Candidatus Spechtbacteria bacterium]|nr:glycosyltransferase family 4 protein [Candidatus Spechtbacteria bacterium]
MINEKVLSSRASTREISRPVVAGLRDDKLKMIQIGIDAHNLELNRAGVARYLENLLREWAKDPKMRGNFHFTLYFKGRVPDDDFLEDSIFTCRSLQILPRPSFFLYFLFSLPLRAMRDKIDIMFFPSYMASPLWRGKSVIVLHDISFERFPELFPIRYRLPYRILGRFGANHSQAVITVSEFCKREIKEIYKVPAEKIFVTYLGVNERIKRASDEEIRRVKQKLDITGEYILWVGQIFNRRHVLESLRAFEIIADKFPCAQFVVSGRNGTSPHQPIDEICGDINRKLDREAVIRVQYAEEKDLPALLSGARVGVYISNYEGFGLPPLEFLACGTPVLAPNTTSLKEALRGEQIIVEDASSVKEIAEKLTFAFTNQEVIDRARLNGPKHAAQFSWKRCAGQTISVFNGVQKN